MAVPEDPVTPLEAFAAEAHELFVALMREGFDKHDALELVAQMALLNNRTSRPE